MGKIKTHRVKHEKLWISVYVEDRGFAKHIGLNIYRSKRAQNDWYRRRRNKRARRAARTHGGADIRCLAVCARLMRLILDSADDNFFIIPADSSRQVLGQYLSRWGFVYSEGFWFRRKSAG